MQSGEAIRKLECSEILPRASVQDLGVVLMGAGYEVKTQYYSSEVQYICLNNKDWNFLKTFHKEMPQPRLIIVHKYIEPE